MPRGQGGGRPSVKPDALAKFLDFVEVGNSIRASAGSAGISAQVIYKVMRLGQRDAADGRRTKYAKFMEQFEAARARAETNYATIIANSAAGNEKLKLPPNTADARFMLAHINPRRWSERMRLDFRGEPPIDRADLLRGVQELAKAVRDEVEDPAILKRIESRWSDIIASWTPTRAGEVAMRREPPKQIPATTSDSNT